MNSPTNTNLSASEDIAIVGMSCMFPGADSPERFWQNVVHKVDCVTDAPADWNPDFFYDASRNGIDRTYTKKGGFLGDLCRFNPVKYGVPPTNIEGAEPDQFIALRCAYEALADAGAPNLPLNRSKTAVIFGRGIFVNRGWATVYQRSISVEQVIQVLRHLEPQRDEQDFDYIREELRRSLPPSTSDTFPGLVHSALAGRIANRFDLMGPSYNVDAACSSTLIAVEHGIRELRAGRCDAVLAGGSQVSTPGPVHVMFCQLQALSKTGKIAPFSAEANGTLLGQGCGLVVLKRRSDAERDGNRIYAVIKSVGVSSDGKGVGLLAPRTEGQQLAIARTYSEANVSTDTVALIEAHGTGIPLGDATEIQSLREGFGTQIDGCPDVALGSVKSMLGHLLPASGVPALIKTALALYHRVIPPMLHAEKAQESLKLTDSRFYLANEARPWLHHRTDAPRRAGINAFGFGGINAHALLEEVSQDELQAPTLERDWPCELVVVSAASRDALIKRLAELATWLRACTGVSLLDFAYSCAIRDGGASRVSIVAKDIPDLIKKLDHASKLLDQSDRSRINDRGGIFWQAEPLANNGRVGFMFPGEGCQYVNMLNDLCRQFPEVRQEFEVTARALNERGRPFSHLLYCQPNNTERAEAELFKMDTAVAAVTAAARGLWRLMDRFQVRADAMVGHSSGEYASLLASGACGNTTAERLTQIVVEGVDSACELEKSKVVPEAALFSAGGVPEHELSGAVQASDGQVEVAMDNCPNQKILVGSEDAVASVLNRLQGKGGLCQRLPWNRPYHTAAFRPASDIVARYIDILDLRAPTVELWSCATADRFPNDTAGIRELAIRQWYSPVRFRETIQAMYDANVRVFVDVGPRGNLAAFIPDILGDKPHTVVSLGAANKPDLLQLCHAMGQLVSSGVSVKVDELYLRRTPKQLDLDAQPPIAPRPEPVLRTDLPDFHLADEVTDRWRSTDRKVRPQLAPQPSSVTPPTSAKELSVPTTSRLHDFASTSGKSERRENGSHTPTIAKSSAELHPVHRPSPARAFAVQPIESMSRSAPVVVTPNHTTNDARVRAISEFQATMMQYLQTQDVVTAAYAQHRAVGRRQVPPQTIVSVQRSLAKEAALPVAHPQTQLVTTARVSPHERPLAAGHELAATSVVTVPAPANDPTHVVVAKKDSSPRQWPFIETVLEFKPGERIVAEAELSIAKHPFLADHTFFGRNVSKRHPDLRALPIMPMAMTFELMAEGAMTLFPDATVSALTDIQAMKWLTCPKHSRRVRIEATTVEDGLVRATVFVADVDGNEEVASGLVELQPRPRTLGAPRFADLQQAPSPWAPEDVYDHLIYHGPAFRGIVEFEDFGQRGLRSRVCQPNVQLLRDWPDSALALPVALIDTASQIAGMVNANYRKIGRFTTLAFPNTIERLEISDAAWLNEPMVANAMIDQSTDKLISNTEVRLASGQTVMRYLGRAEEKVDFPLELYLYALTKWPMRLATSRNELFAGVAGIDQCQLSEVTGAGDTMLVRSHWAQVLAGLVLSPTERQAVEQLHLAPVHLANWLLKRVAVKEAVGQLVDSERRLADIEVTEDATGHWSVNDSACPPLRIQVASDLFFVTSVAAPSSLFRGAGLAVEPLRPTDNAWVEQKFTPNEIAALAALSTSDDSFWRAAHAAKAAFLQACSSQTTQHCEVRFNACSSAVGTFSLTLVSPTGGSESAAPSSDVHYRIQNGRVLALCLILASV